MYLPAQSRVSYRAAQGFFQSHLETSRDHTHKGGSIHPFTGWSAMHYHHNTLTDLSSHPDPQTLTQAIAPPIEDINSSEILLHIKANPCPNAKLLCLALLKNLCPSSKHSMHATPTSCLSYSKNVGSSVAAHTDLVPKELELQQYTLRPPDFYFKALQFTTHDFL